MDATEAASGARWAKGGRRRHAAGEARPATAGEIEDDLCVTRIIFKEELEHV